MALRDGKARIVTLRLESDREHAGKGRRIKIRLLMRKTVEKRLSIGHVPTGERMVS